MMSEQMACGLSSGPQTRYMNACQMARLDGRLPSVDDEGLLDVLLGHPHLGSALGSCIVSISLLLHHTHTHRFAVRTKTVSPPCTYCRRTKCLPVQQLHVWISTDGVRPMQLVHLLSALAGSFLHRRNKCRHTLGFARIATAPWIGL